MNFDKNLKNQTSRHCDYINDALFVSPLKLKKKEKKLFSFSIFMHAHKDTRGKKTNYVELYFYQKSFLKWGCAVIWLKALNTLLTNNIRILVDRRFPYIGKDN